MQTTDDRLKLIEIDNLLHILITVRKNERNLSVFMQQLEDTVKEHGF